MTKDNTPWTTTRNSEAHQCTQHGQTKHPRPDRKARNASHAIKATLLHTDDATTTVQYAYNVDVLFRNLSHSWLGAEHVTVQCPSIHSNCSGALPSSTSCSHRRERLRSSACHHACQHRGGLCVFLCTVLYCCWFSFLSLRWSALTSSVSSAYCTVLDLIQSETQTHGQDHLLISESPPLLIPCAFQFLVLHLCNHELKRRSSSSNNSPTMMAHS